MNRLSSVTAGAMLLTGLFATQAHAAPRAIAADPALEAKVEATLSKMTLEEKIGQMTELTLDALGAFGPDGFKLDEQKLHDAIAVHKVGSVLNVPGTGLTPAEWEQIIPLLQKLSMEHIGIPCIYGLDQNHGTTYTVGGTLFPQNINVGASFNPSLAEKAAEITAYESRAADCPWTYSPTVDLTRDPRWPRVWENFGEDPLVNAVMGSSMVKGFQGPDPNNIDSRHIATSVKHYLGYGAPRTGKDRTPAYISPSELREKFFEPYRACIEAGALTVMVNSGSINGMPVHADHELLTVWLKEDLGWDGMIVTDWADINNLYTRERIAADKKEAIEKAINAGIDMSMEPYSTDFCVLLKELVDEGRVKMSRIDDATRRVLRLKYRLGLFDTPDTWVKDYPQFGSKAHAEVALRAAEESEVLLKNKDGLLPLKAGKRILVTGPNANTMRSLNGGWSYTWQGHLADRYTEQYNTIYEALAQRFGQANVKLCEGVSYVKERGFDQVTADAIPQAVAAAAEADVIVCCIGENSYCETPGNIDDLLLGAEQRQLVKALAETGKPIVLVLNEGRARIIADIEPLADAVIDVLLPGNYGGDALARIIAGDVNPSAKMPYTYPKYPAQLTTYDFKTSEQTEKMDGAYDYDAVVSVQWPFGYGQSYTTFAYSDLRCDKTSFKADDTLTFTVTLTNTGDVAGKEVAMLFSSDLVASLVPDNRRLRAFDKVELRPGESCTVTLTITASDLAFVGRDGRWTVERGEFLMQVGTETLRINCTDTYVWDSPLKLFGAK